MIHFARLLLTAASLAALTTPALKAQTLISGYNFGTASANPLATPYAANHGTGMTTTSFYAGDLYSSTAISTLVNAVAGDTAGAALNVRNSSNANNNGEHLQFSLNMTGYESLVLTYASTRASNGFSSSVWSYSTDGLSFTDFSSVAVSPAAGWQTYTVDFSPVAALNNISTVFVRVTMTARMPPAAFLALTTSNSTPPPFPNPPHGLS